MPEVRPFARHDRDGLTSLANRHITAVLPGGAVPVATLLSQMERDVAEYIVDPWVIDRHTIVGLEADRVVAAAHLKRYGDDDRVGVGVRNAAEVAWIIGDPAHLDAGTSVLEAAMARMREWGARIWHADGALPCLGVYGIPDAWPHVEQLLVDAGFDDDGGQIEVVYAGDISSIPEPGPAPQDGVALRRVVGPLGTSFEAWIGRERVGVFEVEDSHGISNAQIARWADEANHWVRPEHRGRGIGTWLVRHGCAWLRLGGKDRLLAYAIERRARGAEPMEATIERCTPYYARLGLHPITRTRRGWHRDPM
jgi:GNAT superfamily N-acetyltransferase